MEFGWQRSHYIYESSEVADARVTIEWLPKCLTWPDNRETASAVSVLRGGRGVFSLAEETRQWDYRGRDERYRGSIEFRYGS